MHFYPFNIGDFALHTSHLTLEEEAVYRRLLDFYYDTERPIPIETQSVIRRLRLGSHADLVPLILSEFFIKEADGWHNLRADVEINDYHKKGEIARENGKKGGRPKKNNGLETQSVILANPDLTQTKAKQELETVTKKQELRNNSGRMARPTPQELISEFNGRVVNSRQEAESFFNHYESNGWKVGKNPMKSWKHAVTNWITRGKQNATGKSTHKSKSQLADEAVREAIAQISP